MLNQASKGKSKRYGCLLLILISCFVGVSAVYFLTSGIRDAKNIEQTLIDRYDWADRFTPSINGSIAPQRVEAFIRVREAVQSDCADYQAVLVSIGKLEGLDSDQDESASEVASAGFEGLKSVFSAGPRMINFSTSRNQALLSENMGLGEYLYLYLAAYGEQLANESSSGFAKTEEARVSERARREFSQILTNQLLALQNSELQPSYPGLAENLRTEIEALSDGSHSSPWPRGSVGETRNSLAPYQPRINDLYCSGIAQIELLQKNRGFKFEG